MGEYLTQLIDGEVKTITKAGTMDDFRYVRRTELEAWGPFDAGQGTNVPEALRDSSTLWRFPWPQEDGQAVEGIDREMFTTLGFRVPQGLLTKVDHRTICVHVKPKGYGGGVNVFLPCPAGPDGKSLSLSNPGASPCANIYGERWDEEGKCRTIFRCGWCGAPFSVPAEELEEIRDAIRSREPHSGRDTRSWYAKVAERLQPRPPSPPDLPREVD
jgi:hypothetical protein